MAKAKRDYLPPITGEINTPVGPVRFKFIPSGGVPAVVLTNHGSQPAFKVDGREVRIKFMIAQTGPNGVWQRTDAAEPHCDFVDSLDAVPAVYMQEVHDHLLDTWETYVAERPELIPYARTTEVNNDIVQIEEKIGQLEQQLLTLRGRRENMLDLEKRVRELVPARVAPPVSDDQRHVLSEMVGKNCWLSMKDGTQPELHPYSSPDVLAYVDGTSAHALVVNGFVQLHRNLEDGRQTFKVTQRGRDVLKGK